MYWGPLAPKPWGWGGGGGGGECGLGGGKRGSEEGGVAGADQVRSTKAEHEDRGWTLDLILSVIESLRGFWSSDLGSFFFSKLKKIFIIFFGCVGSSLPCLGFSPVAESGDYSSGRRAGTILRAAARTSCAGFSHCGARALGTPAAVVVARMLSSRGSWALERRLSSCGARA